MKLFKIVVNVVALVQPSTQSARIVLVLVIKSNPKPFAFQYLPVLRMVLVFAYEDKASLLKEAKGRTEIFWLKLKYLHIHGSNEMVPI